MHLHFKAMRIFSKKEYKYILLKVSFLQEDIIILNLHTANYINSKEIKQNLSEQASLKDSLWYLEIISRYLSVTNGWHRTTIAVYKPKEIQNNLNRINKKYKL